MYLRRLQDDLQGFFKGEVLFDDIARLLYSTDASIFQVKPAGVVVPRDEEDVCGLVRYAQQNGIAIAPNGQRAYVANNGDGTVSVIDLATNSVLFGTIVVGASPVGIAITPDGTRAFVANEQVAPNNTIFAINTATNGVTSFASGGDGPREIAVVPDQPPTARAQSRADIEFVLPRDDLCQ